MSDNVEQNKPVYLKSVIIENYGPCKNVEYNFRFDENGNPIPLILIGKNGSGKTIFLSHIVNALITAKQVVYENSEVERGKVYKVRAPAYISSGSLYSYSKVNFTIDNTTLVEWQLLNKKEEYLKHSNFNISNPEWKKVPNDATSHFDSTFDKVSAEKLIKNGCIQYFPSNRFEEPAWLNIDNLSSPVRYMDLKNVQTISNRSIFSLSTLKELQNWFFEIWLDKSIHELQLIMTVYPEGSNRPYEKKYEYHGIASLVYVEFIKLLCLLFDEPNNNLQLEFGDRHCRQISIKKNGQPWISNLFQLSSGEILLLNLFLNIIKDFDLSYSKFTTFSNINGIVLIDEIDLHLHVHLQKDILPQLIKLFPKIQFVITTHSPVFLLGMQSVFGTDGFDILNMPTAEPISVEGFTEFQDIFATIRETKTYTDAFKAALQESQLPVVFVEGDYDIKYLTKTIELFYGDKNLLSKFRLFDSNGYGGLNKIWSSMDSKVVDVLSVKILLLYDCDISKQEKSKGKVTQKIIPINSTNPIQKGIENLLSETTIQKLQNENDKFIDIKNATKEKKRGEIINIPEIKTINPDEKKNVCDWLCQNGDTYDFEGFKTVVDIIIEFINQGNKETAL